MRNIFLFFIITFLTGNPIIALLVIVAIYLALDYQYVGLSRCLFRGVRRVSEIHALERVIAINPHDAAAHSDLGRLLVESRRYREAVSYLETAIKKLSESHETQCYLGLAYLWTGKVKDGEALIQVVLESNPKYRYGEPYLRWGKFLLKEGQSRRAVEILEKFHLIHSSSVEGYYLLGEAFRQGGDWEKASSAYRKALRVLKQSPRYKRRTERLWAWKVRFRLLVGRNGQ